MVSFKIDLLLAAVANDIPIKRIMSILINQSILIETRFLNTIQSRQENSVWDGLKEI